MAFDVSTLTAYTDETSQELVSKAVAVGKTLDRITVIPGVKGKEALNFLDNDITIADASCGFTAAGDVAFSQRVLEVTPLEVKDSLCPKTLEKYWMGQLMKPGAGTDVDVIMPLLGETYVEQIQAEIEKQIWVGDTVSSPGYGKIDGFYYKLTQESTRVTATLGSPDIIGGPFTADNIISVVNAMVAAIPEAILDKDGLVLNMSMANYLLYTSALRTANLFHYNGENGQNFETFIPGTSVKAVGVAGLTGTAHLILTYNDNLVYGTDLMNEEEMFKIWYSQDNDEVRVNIQWKMGVQIRFPEFCVCNF